VSLPLLEIENMEKQIDLWEKESISERGSVAQNLKTKLFETKEKLDKRDQGRTEEMMMTTMLQEEEAEVEEVATETTMLLMNTHRDQEATTEAEVEEVAKETTMHQETTIEMNREKKDLLDSTEMIDINKIEDLLEAETTKAKQDLTERTDLEMIDPEMTDQEAAEATTGVTRQLI
jgi:hypothetical protein